MCVCVQESKHKQDKQTASPTFIPHRQISTPSSVSKKKSALFCNDNKPQGEESTSRAKEGRGELGGRRDLNYVKAGEIENPLPNQLPPRVPICQNSGFVMGLHFTSISIQVFPDTLFPETLCLQLEVELQLQHSRTRHEIFSP